MPSHLWVVEAIAAVHLFAVGGVVHMPSLREDANRLGVGRHARGLLEAAARVERVAYWEWAPCMVSCRYRRTWMATGASSGHAPHSSMGGDAFMRLFGIHNVTMCLDNAFYLYAFPQCPIVLMVAGFGCRAFPTPAFHRMGRARRVHPFVTRAPRRSANWPCVSLSILSPPLFTWMVADTSCPLTDNAIMFKESIVDVIFLHVVINSVLNVFPKK